MNLELTGRDKLKPCPFCGGTEMKLTSTHTPSYWIECPCGAEVHARGISPRSTNPDAIRRCHQQAKRLTIQAWNARAPVERETAGGR